jgi:voltage-gated potassium channel
MTFKQKINEVIFGTETQSGKVFDLALLIAIIFSVLVVLVESVPSLKAINPSLFITIEWILTAIFTVEYLLRVWSSDRPKEYIFSFWGIVDLLATLPAYISLFVVGSQYFIIVRGLRLLRVFRILKLTRYNKEAATLGNALRKSRHKISVFLLFVVLIVFIMGTIMYVVEGETNGFTSIPESIYWCIVTITTVGYGDIVPKTVLGKFISSVSMIIGYAIIAIPTGIVSVALNESSKENAKTLLTCKKCATKVDDEDNFCNNCGSKLIS